ncbi:MAG: aminoglycoside phosphotransferase family protein [Lentisphaerae bacterium]|jgi:thiamine kinase-like enzyme|nr:aminoglycoside phosphotransferase family protein [Lentisphaerota bacterium]
MSNRVYSQEDLAAALASMGVTDQTDVSRYGSGHINDTFKVETKRGVRYILQRVNTDIFPQEMLKENIVRVTRFLADKGVKSLVVVGYENPWRLYEFLEGYTSVDLVTNPKEAELVAGAFAKFQNDLADMPPPRLGDIIPKFHNTVDRIRLLDEAAAKDVVGRKAKVAKELAFVDARRAEASKIVDMMQRGDIPERITHNDTKINNVMLAADGTNVVIDLDTTMPGSALYDFGDMVRTSSAAAAEDEKDLSKVYSKKEYFEALVKGYLAQAKFLNEAERANLAFAGRLITLTIGIRFLTDYLSGDTYFRTAYDEHNLVRCHTQFKMVESMEAQAAEYEAIVKKYS